MPGSRLRSPTPQGGQQEHPASRKDDAPGKQLHLPSRAFPGCDIRPGLGGRHDGGGSEVEEEAVAVEVGEVVVEAKKVVVEEEKVVVEVEEVVVEVEEVMVEVVDGEVVVVSTGASWPMSGMANSCSPFGSSNTAAAVYSPGAREPKPTTKVYDSPAASLPPQVVSRSSNAPVSSARPTVNDTAPFPLLVTTISPDDSDSSTSSDGSETNTNGSISSNVTSSMAKKFMNLQASLQRISTARIRPSGSCTSST